VNGSWHGRFAIPMPAVLLVMHPEDFQFESKYWKTFLSFWGTGVF
jgi:hypothetical protein